MTPEAKLDLGVKLAFGFFALSFLMVFAWGILLGFVGWMKSFLG